MNNQVSDDDLQQILFWEQKSKHKKHNQPKQVPEVQNPPTGPLFWEQFQNKFENMNLKMNGQFSNGFPFKNIPILQKEPNPLNAHYVPMKNQQPTQREERNNSFTYQNSSNQRKPYRHPQPPPQHKQQIQHNNFIQPSPLIHSEPQIKQPLTQQPKIVIQEVCSTCNQPKLANHNCNDEYGEIQCPYCSDYIIRNFLNDHLEESCLAYIEHQFKQVDATAECSICMMEIKTDKQLLKCTHSFHKDCIKVWLKKSKECPICRTEV